jgi:hypothetical protein
MVRCSFLVGLFHPRLHAGLSRRLRLLARAAQKRDRVFTRIYRDGMRGPAPSRDALSSQFEDALEVQKEASHEEE